MSFIHEILSPQLVDALAYTFLHSLWIGAALALILYVILYFLLSSGPESRYILAVISMLVFLAVNIFVFFKYYQPEVISEYTKFTGLHTIETAGQLTNSKLADEVNLFKMAMKFYESVYPSLVTIWLAGILVLCLRFAGGLLYNSRLRRKSSRPTREIVDLCAYLVTKMKIKCKVKVAISTLVETPSVVGYLKPVILMPASILMQMPYDQLQAILTHEMAHIKRNDHLVNLLQSVIEVVFFYHPAVWWISAVIRKEREEVCDDMAVAICGNTLVYAQALMKVEESRQQHIPITVAFTGHKNSMLNRLKRLMMKNEKKRNYLPGIFASLLLVSLLTILTVRAGDIVNQTTPASINPAMLIQHFPENNKEIFPTPDTIVQSSQSPNHTLIINTDQEGKQVMIQKQNGNLVRLEVDGKEIEPENYGKYENMISQLEQEIEQENIARIQRIRKQEAEREKMREMRSKRAREREEMYMQRRIMADSIREEHRKNTELMREKMLQAKKIRHEEIREQIEKQIEYLNEIKDDSNLMRKYYRYSQMIPRDMLHLTIPDFESEELEELEEINLFMQMPELPELPELPEVPVLPEWNEQINRQRLLNELYEDGILEPAVYKEVYLTNKKLIVGGEKQPRKIMKKYRDMYEALSGEEIRKDEVIEIQ